MPGLKLKVTTAGRAALVNAGHTGTNAVRIASVGIATSLFAVSDALVALPSEVKRINTVGGTITAADTINVSIRDESTAVYDCYGFGLYLADGTLFAVYSQPELLLGKAAAAMMLLAMDVVFVDIDVQQLTFGEASFTDPAATTEVPGIVELATEVEATEGADKVRVITAYLLQKVLDTRFGAGAPSAFAKNLLGLATAALFRAALELKGAALKDEGADNGLDADKLDGQHGAWYRQWSNLTGVPATATAWPTWDQVQNKPASFPPSGHSHPENVAKAGDTMTGKLTVPELDVADTSFGLTKDSANRIVVRASAGLRYRQVGSGNAEWDIWHGGNFDPNGKLNKAGDTLSGGINFVGNLNQIQYTNGSFIRMLILSNGGDCGIFDQNNSTWGLRYGTDGYVSTRSGFKILGTTIDNEISAGGRVVTPQAVLTGTTNGAPLHLTFASGNTQYMWGKAGAGDNMGYIVYNAASSYTLNWNGAIQASGGFQPLSSRELKTAFRPNPYGLDAVLQLETTLGKYRKWFNPDGRERVFLIAENIAKVIPQVAAGDGIEATPPRARRARRYKGYAMEQMLPVLVKAIQDLHGIVRTQGERIAELEQEH